MREEDFSYLSNVDSKDLATLYCTMDQTLHVLLYRQFQWICVPYEAYIAMDIKVIDFSLFQFFH